MAIYENPKFYKGNPLQRVTIPAVDGHSWNAGQFGRITGSGVVPCKTQATVLNGVFPSTQATDTSTSTVDFDLIPDGTTQFIMYATSSGSDAIANKKYIGQNFCLGVNSCICSVSLSGSTDAKSPLHVEATFVSKDGSGRTATSASPGAYIVSIRPSFLTVSST